MSESNEMIQQLFLSVEEEICVCPFFLRVSCVFLISNKPSFLERSNRNLQYYPRVIRPFFPLLSNIPHIQVKSCLRFTLAFKFNEAHTQDVRVRRRALEEEFLGYVNE